MAVGEGLSPLTRSRADLDEDVVGSIGVANPANHFGEAPEEKFLRVLDLVVKVYDFFIVVVFLAPPIFLVEWEFTVLAQQWM